MIKLSVSRKEMFTNVYATTLCQFKYILGILSSSLNEGQTCKFLSDILMQALMGD